MLSAVHSTLRDTGLQAFFRLAREARSTLRRLEKDIAALERSVREFAEASLLPPLPAPQKRPAAGPPCFTAC